MKIFSLSHLIELAAQLPAPHEHAAAEEGYTPVIRLPLHDWDAVRDSKHPENANSTPTRIPTWNSRPFPGKTPEA